MKKFTLLFAILLSFISTNSYRAQNFVWAKTFGSASYDDWRATAIDASGNVIAVGSFSGTVDFDPGPGVFNLTATAGGDDVFIMKLTSTGNFVWAKRIGTTTDEVASDVITDASSNIYIVGNFNGTVDFDPNAGSFFLTSAGNSDCFMFKLTSGGGLLWAKNMGGTQADWVTAIDIDLATSDLYITGTFQGAGDFNPSASTNTLTLYGAQDIFIGKYDVNGNYVWATSMGGSLGDYAGDIKVNAANTSVFTTGQFSGTGADMSPNCSCGLVNSLGGSDIYVVKLSAAAAGFQALAIMGGTSSESGQGITLDAADNVYVSGQFNGACDMDPGPLTNALGSVGGADAFITKLSSALNYVYAKQIGGLNSQSAVEVVLDPLGNIYTTGSFDDVTDFDPSTSTSYTVQTNGLNSDCYVLKLDNSGNFVWAKTFGSNGIGDYGSDIDLDTQGDVYTIGSFWSTVDFDPSAAVFNLTANGLSDGYIHKLSCTLPLTTTITSSGYTICANTSTSSAITVNNPEPGTAYNWSTIGAGAVFAPTSGTATNMSFTSSNSFSVIATATNACGTTTTIVNTITVIALPSVTPVASPTAVCSGSMLTLNGSGASTYAWSGGVSNNIPFSPASASNYTVTGTNLAGCSNTATINVGVLNNPTVSISGNSLVCLNSPDILTGNGAVSYNWMPGNITGNTIVAQPSANTVYSVTGTGSNGCIGGATFTLSLIFPPTPDICIVTVDSLNQNNEIFWDKLAYPDLDSMIVYREVSTNIYKRIGAVPGNSISLFTDTCRSIGPSNGDPKLSTYRYKIQVRDQCGNYGPMSLWHNTVFFTHTGATFFWVNNYQIEGPINPVVNYSLIVCANPSVNPNYTLVGTTSGNQFQLTDPNYNTYSATADWRVHAYLGYYCYAQKTTQQGKSTQVTRSNISNNRAADIGVREQGYGRHFKIYPNPADNYVLIDLNADTEEADLKIYDALGKCVHAEKVKGTTKVDVSGMCRGIYTLKLQNNGLSNTIKLVLN
jgi:hypothetical protein